MSLGIEFDILIYAMMCWRYCFPASRNYTSVKITPTPSGDVKTLTLEAGGYYEFEIPSRESVIVRSNKTVLLAQLCKSFKADDTRNSDPFMTLITPTSQISNYYVYSTPGLDRYKHYVNLFVDTSHIDGIRLDGRALEDPDFLSSWRNAGRNYAVAKLKMVPGVHVLTHANHARFGATAYGFKKQESYGFSLGFYARDFREDFPPKATTRQVLRTTTREVYATTTFVNTPEWTLARSTEGTTVDEKQADAARTVGPVPTTTTSVVGDVMPTTSTMTIPYSRQQYGMTNVTSSWNSSEARGNVSSADNSTISIQRNTTITPTLDNSTVIPASNISTTAVPVPNYYPFDNKEITSFHVTSDRTFDPRNKSISKNYTDIPSATTTTPSDNSNMTALFQSESTVSSSHVSATSATGTVRIGSMVTKTEMFNDSATSSNTASTLSHVHTPIHTVSGVESVNVTMNNIASAFNDTTTISSTNVEGNESIRTTTEAMLLNENTTENDALADELATSATLSILTALISSRWNLDNLKHLTTPAKQSEPVNASSTDSEEPSPFGSVNNSDTSSTNEPNTTSSTTQIRSDMTLATESTFQNVMNMTSGRVTELPSRNYSDTTTHGINVAETHQPNTTHASPPNISETSTTHASAPNISVTNTTRMSVPILSHSVPVSTRISFLDPGISVGNVTFRQSLENRTTPGISTAANDGWNSATQANATIPTTNPEVYFNNTTEQWLDEQIDNTQIKNESDNETIAKEANQTDVPTFINAATQTTKSSITTIRIAKEKKKDGIVNATTMSPSIPYFDSNSSMNSTLRGRLDNASLQENNSSLDGTPSTSIEVTSISPIIIENVTSSDQIEEITHSNLNSTIEYVKKMNDSTPGYAESYQRQFNETTPISHALKTVGESTATPFMSSFPNNNDTSYTSIVTSQYTILTTGSSEPTHKTTTYSTLEAIDDTDIAKPHDNRATTIEIPSVVVKTSRNTLVTYSDYADLMTPASTTTDQSTSASAATDVEVTFGPDGHSEQGTTYPLATTDTDEMLVNNSPQSPTHDSNLSTAVDTINQQNRNNLTTPTSVVTPIAQEMSAKKDDITLMVTIIVATLFGLPLLVICGCLCYGLCCGICRKHGRGACCGCAKRRRRNSRVRPTSQWSSSSQRSASSSRSSMVYIDPSVLESKGLVPQPQRKRKLNFLNFYQKPSCSSWVEVVDEQADDNNKRRDHRSARSAKDLRGKVKGKGKRRMSSYERNRKVGPTLDGRPPLPRTSTNSRMQSYIVRN